MRVSELIEQLKGYDPDLVLILQKDPEGNGYRPLSGSDLGVYVPDTWFGDFYDVNWTAEDAGLDEDEWNALKNTNLAVVLYP